MIFTSRQQVRFAHVDAANIVFYPRYFEMLNATVEDYFAQVIGIDFAHMHGKRRLGVPTVRLEVDFLFPSRLGDLLDYQLGVANVGRSSAEFALEVRAGDEVRLRGSLFIVCMDLDQARPAAWPEDMRPVAA